MFTCGPVTFDDEFVVLGQYDDAERWNGWLLPRLDAHSVVAVLEHLNASADVEDPGYDWTFTEGDLVLTDRRYLAEDAVGYVPEVVTPNPDGLYPLGAFSWCWYPAHVHEVADEQSSPAYQPNWFGQWCACGARRYRVAGGPWTPWEVSA